MTTEADPAECPSIRVIEAVADAEGVPATDLDCLLADAIDPQALDGLFHSRLDGDTATAQVQFSYCGYTVTVHADGTVGIE